VSKILGKTREIVLFSEKSGKCCPFRHWKFRKFWKFKPEWKATFVFSVEYIVFFVSLLLLFFAQAFFTDRESENSNNKEFCATQYFLTVVGRIKLFTAEKP